METLYALLTLCDGNPLLTLVNPSHKGPVMRSFDIFFFFHPDQAAEKTCRVDDVMILMTQKKRKKEDFNDASG